jgi:uncharacterized membrane protein
MGVSEPTTDPSDGASGRHGAGAPPTVAPSLDDPLANLASDAVGGPLGKRAKRWVPGAGASGKRGVTIVARVLILLTLLTAGLGIVQRAPCYNTAWNGTGHQQYNHLCYSDVPYMYYGRGFMDGKTPYRDTEPSYQGLEYPVVTGAVMETASLIAHKLGGETTATANRTADQVRWFYNVTTWFLLAFACITVLGLIGLAGRRPWDAAMFALAPGLFLTGTINWDLIAVGLTTAGMLAWARKWHVAAGVLLGLGSATKLYPMFLLIPLLVLCWRAGRMQQWTQTFVASVAAWFAVNLPVLLMARHGWGYFFTFNKDRPVDLGSVWFVFKQWWSWEPPSLNVVIIALLGACWLGVALIGLMARRRPRFAQLAFLTVATFVLLNKVYSPQYVLWLIPLAALARPRWRDFLIWQGCEAVYYVSVWYYLVWQSGASNGNVRGLPAEFYTYAVVIHLIGTVYMMVQVVRDALDPRRDPVRVDGEVDDPAGGVLADSPDVWAWAQPRSHRHSAVHGEISGLELVSTT